MSSIDRIRQESERTILGREFNPDVYADVHRAYIDPVSLKIRYYGTDTVKVKDGFIYCAAAGYYNRIQDKTDALYPGERERTQNIFRKTNILSFLSFPDYMAYDTNIFHFIYNDSKYKEASIRSAVYFSYQADLSGHVNAENIYTDRILTVDELPFAADALVQYAVLLKRDYGLSDQDVSGVTWELLKRGHLEYFTQLREEKYGPKLNENQAETAEDILKSTVDRGSIKLSDMENITMLAYAVLASVKRKLLSFPDAAVYTIFKLDEFLKEKKLRNFENMIK